MRQRASLALASALVLLTLAPLGCGGDHSDRGLAPKDEVATPESAKAMDETEAQRDKQTARQEQSDEAKDFDRSEDQ